MTSETMQRSSNNIIILIYIKLLFFPSYMSELILLKSAFQLYCDLIITLVPPNKSTHTQWSSLKKLLQNPLKQGADIMQFVRSIRIEPNSPIKPKILVPVKATGPLINPFQSSKSRPVSPLMPASRKISEDYNLTI